MSCQLKPVSIFADSVEVRKFLFPDIKEEADEDADSGWNEANWEWKDDDIQESYAPEKKTYEQSWLQHCLISLSPTSDSMALATSVRIVHLTLKWDNHEEGDIKSKFTVLWQDTLVEDKRSCQGNPDWTCIIVGFTSGYVRMYTENGVQLLNQLFHEEPVYRLKCRTYEPPRHLGASEQQEDLLILYKWALVTVDGFSLFQTLRACRNHVAKATASGADFIAPPPLAYKKWGFQDQDKILDCSIVGLTTPNMFDHLQTASLLGGFGAVTRNSIPSSSLLIGSGSLPFLAFYYAMEGSSQPLMSEVAVAVASKLKSVLFSAASGLLGFGHKIQEDQRQHKPVIEPATPLNCRFGLPDSRRCGESLCISPNRTLAVVTDNFGRVILIDTNRGVAVRIWKGYRDAQCGWIEVVEDTHLHDKEKVTPVPRKALFLVIYAPRRGLLEIWTTQQGPRVAAFNVSKWARLLYQGYGMMGLTSSSLQTRQHLLQCCLLDSDGFLKTISVPFHFALSDKNSKRARDLHLLKKLKIALKEMANHDEGKLEAEITKSVVDMKTASIKHQALETLIGKKKVPASVVESAVVAVVQQLTQLDSHSLDFESKLLLQSCQRLTQLLTTFRMIEDLNLETNDDNLSSTEEENQALQVISAVMHTTEEEMECIFKLLRHYRSVTTAKSVHFSNETYSASAFLSSFYTNIPQLNKDLPLDETLPITLSSNISEEQIVQLGHFLFSSCLQKSCSVEKLESALRKSGILPEKIMSVLVSYWLNQPTGWSSYISLLNFSSIVKSITNLSNLKMVTVDYNEVSPWWQNVRSVLSQSNNIPTTYTTAIVCRGVALTLSDPEKKIVSKITKPNPDHSSQESVAQDDWESVSMDTMQWNLISKQLEDLLVLSTLLHYRPPVTASCNNCMEISRVAISLNSITEKGRGVVSEIVAEWLTQTGLDFHLIKGSESATIRNNNNNDIEEAKEAILEMTESYIEEVSELLGRVQKRFPFSLQHDVLSANCSWEYALKWNKDPDTIQHLRNSLRCLKIIDNSILKHGVGSMMWHMFVSKRFTDAALLIEKVGKVPKERLCRRDIGLSDVHLEKFLGNCVDLLDILMEVNISYDLETSPTFGYEDLWQQKQGPAPLVELAISQKQTNYALICLHYQLALTLHMVVVFSLKSVKPISFYDTKGKSALFRDLHMNPPIPIQDIDISLLQSRSQFLRRVISAAVQSVPDSIPDVNNTEMSSLSTKVDHSNMSHWVGRVMDLAKLWGLDSDVLRRHEVCELYSSGLDLIAEEILPSISDHALMGSQLIILAGQRLHCLVMNSNNTLESLSRLSPTLTTWLKALDHNNLSCKNPSLGMTRTLISHVVNLLPEDHSEYKMAVGLVEAVHSLNDKI